MSKIFVYSRKVRPFGVMQLHNKVLQVEFAFPSIGLRQGISSMAAGTVVQMKGFVYLAMGCPALLIIIRQLGPIWHHCLQGTVTEIGLKMSRCV